MVPISRSLCRPRYSLLPPPKPPVLRRRTRREGQPAQPHESFAAERLLTGARAWWRSCTDRKREGNRPPSFRGPLSGCPPPPHEDVRYEPADAPADGEAVTGLGCEAT